MDEQEAAGRIADAFGAGIAPWSRSHRLRFTCGLPVDPRSGEPFRGVDVWLLELAAIRGRYRSPHWATARDWGEIGGEVLRREVASVPDQVLPGKPGGGNRVLYNLEQVEVRRGSPVTLLDHLWVAGTTMSDYGMAERVVKASGARVVADDCCRCVVFRDGREDFIGMPPLSFFGGDRDRYWSVMFHELTHWVVLRSRKDCWNRDPSPGELVAEVGAAILTTRCGIPMAGYLDRDGDHVEDWIKGIRYHHGYLTHACKVAELAAEYLLYLAGYER
jgi:antirestriction protein ArdC